ncbi:hypothetical protein JVU11DRAFT_10010 [Chiua virens]|nr:hypothetical protein JVU11DRAFT_10010 [Chiua virens]
MSENGPEIENRAASYQHRKGLQEETGHQRALAVVQRYKHSKITKAGAILKIQEVLFEGGVVVTTEDLIQALPAYISMLDEIDDSRQANHSETGILGRSLPSFPSGPGDYDDGPSGQRISSGELARGSVRRRASFSTEKARSVPTKRGRFTVNEDHFPWKGTDSVLRSQLEPELQHTLLLLEDWAKDPTQVVRSILITPGCPDFPADQWLNIVNANAVDLSRVLRAHYSSSVEAHWHQTHDLQQLSEPKCPTSVSSHGDWIIAFGKTIQATAFALPGRYSEYVAYQTYISNPFATIHPSFHDRVIEYDKAIRLRAAHKNIYASLILLNSTTCASLTSLALAWARLPPDTNQFLEFGETTKDHLVRESEILAATGIEIHAVGRHLVGHNQHFSDSIRNPEAIVWSRTQTVR